MIFQTEAEEAILNKKRSKKAEQKYRKRQKLAKVDPGLEEQFHTSRLLGKFEIYFWCLSISRMMIEFLLLKANLLLDDVCHSYTDVDRIVSKFF